MWNYWVPNSVLQSRNPNLQTHGSRNRKVYFWHLPRARILSIPNLAAVCFKIPNPEFQWRENQDPEKPNGFHQIKPNIIIRYLALHSVSFMYIFVSASNFWKLATPNTQNPRTLFMNKIMIWQIFAFSSIKTHHKLWLIFMISQTLRKGKYFSKIMNLKLSKSEYLSGGTKTH